MTETSTAIVEAFNRGLEEGKAKNRELAERLMTCACTLSTVTDERDRAIETIHKMRAALILDRGHLIKIGMALEISEAYENA